MCAQCVNEYEEPSVCVKVMVRRNPNQESEERFHESTHRATRMPTKPTGEGKPIATEFQNAKCEMYNARLREKQNAGGGHQKEKDPMRKKKRKIK